jgi:hypothetical protein
MRIAQAPRGRLLLASFFLASHVAMGGCNDDSKTTGTSRVVSEEDQAHLKSKMESYKGGNPNAKAKGKSATAGKK